MILRAKETLMLFMLSAVFNVAQAVEVTQQDFGCLKDMTAVKHFYVDNVLGDLNATVAVAQSSQGGEYPVGSLLQQIPTEAMLKRESGFNPDTNDWEFLTLRQDSGGSQDLRNKNVNVSFLITQRGGAEVTNANGQSCATCHSAAPEQWDMTCGNHFECSQLATTRREMRISVFTDPRCSDKPWTAQEKTDMFYHQHELARDLKQEMQSLELIEPSE